MAARFGEPRGFRVARATLGAAAARMRWCAFSGEVSERLKERDWKSRGRVFPASRVRIPPSPLLRVGANPPWLKHFGGYDHQISSGMEAGPGTARCPDPRPASFAGLQLRRDQAQDGERSAARGARWRLCRWAAAIGSARDLDVGGAELRTARGAQSFKCRCALGNLEGGKPAGGFSAGRQRTAAAWNCHPPPRHARGG